MLIVGLGNPGEKYTNTRHNAGAMLLEHLKNEWDLPDFKLDKYNEAVTSKGNNIFSTDLLTLSFPQTFMNESGKSVSNTIKKENISTEKLLVLHDDKDISFGEIRLQKEISSAGHKGVQSIIDALGTNSFWRLRVGIGPVPEFIPTEDFVLQNFSADELEKMPEFFQNAKLKIEQFLKETRV